MMLKLKSLVVFPVTLLAVQTYCFSGLYDVNEVRSTLYEPDIFSVLAGIDPSFNLSSVTSQNKESILEKILSDLPTIGDEGYVFIKSKTGQVFACKMPKVQQPEKSEATSYNPKYLAELVSASFYVKNCINKDNGWWNYKLCRGIDVKQWHGAKNEADQITNSLGIFLGKYDVPSYQTSTPERLMYLEEQYEGGTLCDLPDKKSPRKTAVRYECDPQLSTSEAYIHHVEEAASCEYIITVKVGSLCSLSAFMPPNLIEPNKIVCQPFASKEAIEKFLEDSLQKRIEMKEAAARARQQLDLVRRIQRRRASMRRTELLRDTWLERSALRTHIDNEYHSAVTNYIGATIQARTGEISSNDVAESVSTLTREVDDIEKVFYSFDYLSERDQDAGNLWFYFHDGSWNKTHFPKSLDYVDIMNGYYNAASKMVKNYPNMALTLHLFPLLRKDPWNPDYNLLLHGGISSTMRAAVLQDVPLFVAPSGEESLDDETAKNIGTAKGLFGYRASSIVNAFMKHVRDEFIKGVELVKDKEDMESVLGTQLVPAYKFIELTLLQGRFNISDNVRANIASDMAKMLDRLCVAYELAQIRFDLDQPNNQLSFSGVASGKKANIMFDDFYLSITRKRTEKEKYDIYNRQREVMKNLLAQFSRQLFEEQWFTLSEMLLYKKREEDAIKYGKHSASALKNPFLEGKIVVTSGDVKDIMSLINTAGFEVDDMKMEVVATNVLDGTTQKFTSEEMRLLQEVIKRQIEDLRDMKRINQREQAYGAVIDQEMNAA